MVHEEQSPTSSDGKAVLERLTKIAAAGTALTSMAAGVLSVYREVQGATVPLIEELERLPTAVRWAVIALLFLVPIYLFVQQRRRRSKPAPAPGGAGPRSLIGRDRDLKNLRKACINNRLVFVVGDSGVGKSTLIDNLSFEGADLFGPVVVRHWGDHWIQGPARIVGSALAKLLESVAGSSGASVSATAPAAGNAPAIPDVPAAPDLPANPEHPADAAVPGVPSDLPWFAQIRALFKKRNGPLSIVFDGFDDYSVRFHEQLFEESESRFFRPAELREANAFWAEVAKLLDEGVIHCVFVTRSDAQSALDPVRFVEPEVLHISRLPRGTAENLLDEIFAAPQGDPDWEPLRDQLLDDLDDGGVLPAQAIAAERALRLLPRRTLRDYLARGGLVGLELAQLEELVVRASLASTMTPTTARQLLQLMVDESSTPPKARPLSLSDTDPSAAPPGPGASTVQGVSVSRDAARKLMVELAREDIVRPSASQPDTWTLYHDYVARVIAAMNKRADRWTTLLSEAHKAARSARGIVARYRALLSPTTQLVFVAQRLFSIGPQRGFRYRGHRRFAVASLLRFLPSAAVIGGLFYWWVTARATDSGRQLFAQLSSRASAPHGSEVDALWRLKQSDPRAQDAFLAHALALPETAATFSRRAPYFVHAIVGFDRQRRADVLAVVRKRCVVGPEPDLRLAGACLHTGLVLEDNSVAFWQFAMTSLLRKLREAVHLEDDSDPELSFESWVAWLVRAPALGELPEGPRATLFAGLQEILALPALSKPRERGRDRLAHSLSLLFQRFRLRVPEPLVVPFVNQVALAQRFPATDRLELAWMMAAVQPGKEVAGHIADLLLQMPWGIGSLAEQSSAPFPEKRANGALYMALIAHAGTLPSAETRIHLLDTLERLLRVPLIEPAELPRITQALAAARPKLGSEAGSAQEVLTEPDDDNPLDELSKAVEQARPELDKLARGSFADEIKRADEGWDQLRSLIRPRQPQPFIERFWDLTRQSPLLCVLAIALLSDDGDLEDEDSPLSKMFEGHSWDNKDPKQTWFQACLKSYSAVNAEDVSVGTQGIGFKKPSVKVEDIVKDIIEGRRDPFKEAFEARTDLQQATGEIDQENTRALLARILSSFEKYPDQQEIAIYLTTWTVRHSDDAPKAAKQLIELTRDVDKFEWNRLLVTVLADKELQDEVIKEESEILSELDDVLIRMITLMQSSPQGSSLSPFVATLCATPNIDRAPVFKHLTSTLLNTIDIPRFEALRSCLPGLRGLPAGFDVPDTILQLLEWPTCVGACRADLIRFLNQEEPGSGKTFWAVEEWARKQALPRRALVKPQGT